MHDFSGMADAGGMGYPPSPLIGPWPRVFGCGAGVISANPLRMEVAGNIQEKDDLIESRGMPPLEVGDHCLLVPLDDEQQYWIICVRR